MRLGVCAVLASTIGCASDYDAFLTGAATSTLPGTTTVTTTGTTTSSSTSSGGGGSSSTGGGGAGPGGAGGANVGGSGGATTTCLLAGLEDDFQDNAIGPLWNVYQSDANLVAEAGGKATFTPPPNNGSTYGGYFSVDDGLALSSCSILVKLEAVPPTLTSVFGMFDPLDQQGTKANFEVADGVLTANLFVADNQVVLETLPSYDPTKPIWLRLREEAGMLHWDAAKDGKAWKSIASTATPALVGAFYVAFGGGESAGDSNPGKVRFDDFGLPPP